MNTDKIIAYTTGLLTLLLALFSFVLSFNALADLAAIHDVSIPPLFPFVVEAAVIVFSLNALYRSLQGESAKVQWALIIGSSLLAGLFNVAHAQADWLSRLMAAMPSLFLLLSFESFLSLVKHGVTKQGAIKSIIDLNHEAQQVSLEIAEKVHDRDTLQATIEAQQTRLEDLKRATKAARLVESSANEPRFVPGDPQALALANDTRQAQMTERRERVLDLLHHDMTQAGIADELGVSVATIKRDIKALNGRVSQ